MNFLHENKPKAPKHTPKTNKQPFPQTKPQIKLIILLVNFMSYLDFFWGFLCLVQWNRFATLYWNINFLSQPLDNTQNELTEILYICIIKKSKKRGTINRAKVSLRNLLFMGIENNVSICGYDSAVNCIVSWTREIVLDLC